jgi:hypothetical protein
MAYSVLARSSLVPSRLYTTTSGSVGHGALVLAQMLQQIDVCFQMISQQHIRLIYPGEGRCAHSHS